MSAMPENSPLSANVSGAMSKKMTSTLKLSKYGSYVDDEPREPKNSEDSDGEYGDIDHQFSLQTIEYPTHQPPTRSLPKAPTPTVVYEPVRLGSRSHTPLPSSIETESQLLVSRIESRSALPHTSSWASQTSVDVEALLSRGYTLEQAAEIAKRKQQPTPPVETSNVYAGNARMKKNISLPMPPLANGQGHAEGHRAYMSHQDMATPPDGYGGFDCSPSSSPKLPPFPSPRLPPSPNQGPDRRYFFANDEPFPEERPRARPTSMRSHATEQSHAQSGTRPQSGRLQPPSAPTALSGYRSPVSSPSLLYGTADGFPREASPPIASPTSLGGYGVDEHDGRLRGVNDRALARALLLSEQEAQYGFSMCDPLSEVDDLALSQHLARGLDMDAALLLIFENKVGKTTTKTKSRSQAHRSPLTTDAAQSYHGPTPALLHTHYAYAQPHTIHTTEKRARGEGLIDFIDEHGNQVVLNVDHSSDEEQSAYRRSHHAGGYHRSELVTLAPPPPPYAQQSSQHYSPSLARSTSPTSAPVPYYLKYHQLHVQAQSAGLSQAPQELLELVMTSDDDGLPIPPNTLASRLQAFSMDSHDSEVMRSYPKSPPAVSPNTNAITVGSRAAVATAATGGQPSRSRSNSTSSTTSGLMPGLKRSRSFLSMLGLASKVKLDLTAEEKILQKRLGYKDDDVISLMVMGFPKEQSIRALVECDSDLPRATHALLHAK